MIINRFMYTIIIFTLFINLTYPQIVCNDGYVEINDECYSEADIAVIDVFLQNSPNINLILDTNNNGFVEELELCDQEWNNGRLISIDCNPVIINGNYNWLEVSGQIPSMIANWSQIESLLIPYNNLYGTIPEDICNLNLDFSNNQIFNLQSNDLCPPYPECIEDYMGTQSNWGSGSCDVSNCYDVGITQLTALELNGDNYLNPYEETYGTPQLLVTMHNAGPHCSAYPGLMITADVPGTSFETEQNNQSIFWWYAIAADDTYFSNINFEISAFVPPETPITITAQAVTMGCLDEGCSEDPYCHECPLSDPISITLNVGSLYPSYLGDVNIDQIINVLDIILVVSFILEQSMIYFDETNAVQVYLSNVNQDTQIDILDIIALLNLTFDS